MHASVLVELADARDRLADADTRLDAEMKRTQLVQGQAKEASQTQTLLRNEIDLKKTELSRLQVGRTRTMDLNWTFQAEEIAYISGPGSVLDGAVDGVGGGLSRNGGNCVAG